MGRTEPSIGRPPAAFRKDARSKKAKATINKVIPNLLPGYPGAQKGINSAELIPFMNTTVLPEAYGKLLKKQEDKSDTATKGKSTDGAKDPHESLEKLKTPRISIREVDTLTAARDLLDIETPAGVQTDLGNTRAHVTILNMGSPLNPGGGFLNGANSQEESLCMRTTLYPSLKDEWYRLPEFSSIWTPMVLVFRDEDGNDLDKKDRFYVDCITAAMIRGPEFELDEDGVASYANKKDRDTAQAKMRAVMRIAMVKKSKRLVLGAWGCGAHGNPVGEIARVWKSVLTPRYDKSKLKERWEYIDEIVFAIKDHNMAQAFADAWGDGLERQDEDKNEIKEEEEDAEVVDLADVKTQELKDKIRELEQRIQRVNNPKVSDGLKTILEGLKKQLPEEVEVSTQDSEWEHVKAEGTGSS
ncbi:hypothetical protein DER46DRAFT_629774 [Fusarium sp. MPI-SDFR-AT-0072]|uniref:Microbial-type PARG catalytic domain-containing protein n=1 Tax=Fusarium oxysporum f. sp. rapae TaxID=485398 RepID=A0A8J5U0S1_FUSOX|nr:hypothetical protein Forpe1208_v014015 [Fusarium oxysporum f. sp. rapae]KAH7147714.1 hypothetical protein DER46DRAFT_629774 [Fusarium sp. MPI-SDFR-AT-0072]KAI7769206.1 hypothetical protein LZL87_011923 [Fusarium oxysporum]